MLDNAGVTAPTADETDAKWLYFESEDGNAIYVNAGLARSISASIGGRSLIKFDQTHTVIVEGSPAEVVARLRG